MTSGERPSDDDLARIVEYVDGTLEEADMIALEARFEREPELARALADFEGIDRLQRRGASRGSFASRRLQQRRRGPRLVAVALAAAAVALLGAGVWLLARSQPPIQFQIATLGIANASPEQVNHVLGLEETWLPSRVRGATDPDAPPPPDDEEYLRAALQAQGELARSVLASSGAETTAGRFAIVLCPDTASWAVVVAVPDVGPATRLHPEPGRYEVDPLVAGVPSFLPRPFVAERSKGGAPSADFDYGFLVPLGAGQLRVLVALAGDAPGRELLDELDRRLSAGAMAAEERLSAIRTWFRESGFSVAETLVTEGD